MENIISNWFMAVDHQGKWIKTGGVAKVCIDPKGRSLRGTLYLGEKIDEPADAYHHFVGVISSDGMADIEVSSPSGSSEPFNLSGPYFSSAERTGINETLVLTDGTTVFGLALRR
jgi:hypothetical protein